MPNRPDRLDEVLALLREQGARLARLEAALLSKRRPVDPARLYSSIARVLGGSVWSTGDLQRLATSDPELREVIGKASRRKLGALLRGLRDRASGPYRLTAAGRDERGTLWRLTVDADIHAQPSAPAREGARSIA